jgi:hypothetical protein
LVPRVLARIFWKLTQAFQRVTQKTYCFRIISVWI